MASHCHLIDQFWSANSNARTDSYGGSLENRLRFGIRVLEGIRRRTGPEFVIGIRVTADDFVDGGLSNERCQEIAKRLDELKIIDYFNVIGGTAEVYIGEAAAVPDTPNKAREGRLDDIRQCMGYNQGCIDRIYAGLGVTCVQNAVIGREREWANLPRADASRKVVIVGAGAAGLECARVARMRGHQVVLLEKNSEAGGQTLIAKKAPFRQDFDGACRYAYLQCRKLGVDMRFGTEAEADAILAESPDVVVIATGARAFRPNMPGIEQYGYSAWEVLDGVEVPGERLLEEALGPFDAFVYAYGGQAIDDLSRELRGRVSRVELIGDSFAPRTIQHAILEGHRLARLI